MATGPASRLAIGLFAGALAASVVYNALFLMLSVLTSRAAPVGLLYLLIWEGLLGSLVGGVRLLSVDQYALGIAGSIAPGVGLGVHLSLATAVIMGVIVTVLALVLAARRLSAFTIKGDAA